MCRLLALVKICAALSFAALFTGCASSGIATRNLSFVWKSNGNNTFNFYRNDQPIGTISTNRFACAVVSGDWVTVTATNNGVESTPSNRVTIP